MIGSTAYVSRPRAKKAASQTPSIQSLDRGLFILEAVAKSSDPVALGHLTDLLGIDRSSVFRLANTLRRRGFLANPNGRKDYILGPSIWRLSRKHDWSNVLITFSHEHLRRLAVRTGETTHLALREGRQAFFIDHYHSTSQIILISGQTGEFVPLYCTAHGKALLTDCDLSDLKSIFGAGPLQAYTPQTIVSIKQLAKDCAQSKERGFVLDDEEYVAGVRCLAAPVRDKDGIIIASIGISAPVGRFPEERDAVAARQVCEIAKELSAIFSAETHE
jgi:IclR family transcriptional regulator, acetate operon repressor